MTLRIGWWDHFEQIEGVPLDQQYDERLRLLKLADVSGFYGYHDAEHHLTPLDMAPSPLMFLTAAARETQSIRLGTLVLVLPLYNPVRLLQEIYMVDNLSHGRLMPGVGRGVRDVEHEWFGHGHPDARPRFASCLAFLRSALATDVAHLDGVDVPTNFSTCQKPMRFWYAGNMKAALEGAMNAIGAGKSDDYDAFVEGWASRRDSGDPAHHRNFGATSLRVGGSPGPVGHASVRLDRSGAVYGSVETVTERLAAYVERLGTNHTYFAPSFQWGDMTHDEALRSMEAFAAEAMPALQAHDVGASTPSPMGGPS